jgi:hypothetical protein
VFFTLLAYWLSLRDNIKSSALAGLYSVFCRQTNIIWVLFIAAASVLDDFEGTNSSLPGLSAQFWAFLSFLWKKRYSITLRYWPFIAVGVTFAGFVKLNGGVVVGDRSNHIAALHWAQPLYFLVFACFAPTFASVTPVAVKALLTLPPGQTHCASILRRVLCVLGFAAAIHWVRVFVDFSCKSNVSPGHHRASVFAG